MAELTKEMESLRASYQQRDSSSIHSGEHSIAESTGSDSGGTSAAAGMAKVQKCQHRIQELEKEAERARFNNRHLMQQYAEQLKVSKVLQGTKHYSN